MLLKRWCNSRSSGVLAQFLWDVLSAVLCLSAWTRFHCSYRGCTNDGFCASVLFSPHIFTLYISAKLLCDHACCWKVLYKWDGWSLRALAQGADHGSLKMRYDELPQTFQTSTRKSYCRLHDIISGQDGQLSHIYGLKKITSHDLFFAGWDMIPVQNHPRHHSRHCVLRPFVLELGV